MADTVNPPPAGASKAIRSWAGGVFEMLVEARREETRRALARVLWTQCVPTLEGVNAAGGVTCVAPTWPQVERRGPNRATNVTRMSAKRAQAKAEALQTEMAVAGGGKAR